MMPIFQFVSSFFNWFARYFHVSIEWKSENNVKAKGLLLYDFPDVIHVMFITSWLSFHDFVVFDTASCNHLTRKLHLRKVGAQNTVFSSLDRNFKNTISVVEWMTKKQISTKVMFWSENPTYNCKLPNKFKSTSVKTLVFGNIVGHRDYVSLIHFFQNNLEALHFFVCHNFNPSGLHDNFKDELFKSCPKLTEIIWECTEYQGHYFPDKMLHLISKGCPNLTSLGVPGNTNLSDTTFVQASKNWPNLCKLNISKSSLSGVSVISALLINNTPFKAIEVTNCKKITDEVMQLIAQQPDELTVLTVTGTNVTTIGLHLVFTSCIKLTRLDVSHFPHAVFIDAFQVNYAINLNLKWLDLSQTLLNDDGLKIIADHYPNISYFIIQNCTHITHIGMQYIALSFSKLITLDVSVVPVPYGVTLHQPVPTRNNAVQLLSDAISIVVQNNPLLETLIVCERFVGIDNLNNALRSSDIKLKYLDLSRCAGVTDNQVVELARLSPSLRVLNLARCVMLTDISLRALTEHCTVIRDVNFIGCEKLSLTGITLYTKACKMGVVVKH